MSGTWGTITTGRAIASWTFSDTRRDAEIWRAWGMMAWRGMIPKEWRFPSLNSQDVLVEAADTPRTLNPDIIPGGRSWTWMENDGASFLARHNRTNSSSRRAASFYGFLGGDCRRIDYDDLSRGRCYHRGPISPIHQKSSWWPRHCVVITVASCC